MFKYAIVSMKGKCYIFWVKFCVDIEFYCMSHSPCLFHTIISIYRLYQYINDLKSVKFGFILDMVEQDR